MEDYELAEEQDKQAFVNYLYDNENLSDDTERGVSRKYIADGYDSLTANQQAVIDRIVEEHSVAECGDCSNSIPWSEQIEALDSGICGYCQHRRDRAELE